MQNPKNAKKNQEYLYMEIFLRQFHLCLSKPRKKTFAHTLIPRRLFLYTNTLTSSNAVTPSKALPPSFIQTALA